jgi:predicted GIY-YIG superfamily endonuclease
MTGIERDGLCERSETMQSNEGRLDCVVARAPRNDVESFPPTSPRHCELLRSNPGATREVSMKQPCVYIMASGRNGTLYAGVTSNLPKRAFEHREGQISGFSKKYGCKILVWYELHETMIAAITREKQIKAGSRAKKLALIEEFNPGWEDLYDTLI